MIDILICASLIAFGSAVLGLAWVFIEGIAAIRKWKSTWYRGKHLR